MSDEDFWSLLWYDPSVPAAPIDKLSTWHYFPDHEVLFWRTDWTPNATTIAFKSGPPERHHTGELLKQFRDWHLSAGHAHPDANSFILFANGKYLTGDSGYAGVPTTAQDNTLLVDGVGQGREDNGHDPWSISITLADPAAHPRRICYGEHSRCDRRGVGWILSGARPAPL